MSFRSRNETAKDAAAKVSAAMSCSTKVAEYKVPTYAVAFPKLLRSGTDREERATPATKLGLQL